MHLTMTNGSAGSRRRGAWPAVRLLTVLLAAAAANVSAATLVGISGDSFGVPRTPNSIDPAALTSTAGTNLGDGSIGFTGGLAYDAPANVFYAIGSDSFGVSAFYSYSDPANPVSLLSLGSGFFGGLAYTGNSFYAISNDMFGASTLNEISTGGGGSVTPVFVVGNGFSGGLAYRATNGLLYGITNDSFGVSSLYEIDPVAMTATVQSIVLGSGFYGGLAYNPVDDTFFAISVDPFGASTLYSFGLSDASPTVIFGVGTGFAYSGLTYVGAAGSADPPAVPEPSTTLLLGAGLASLALLQRQRRRGARG